MRAARKGRAYLFGPAHPALHLPSPPPSHIGYQSFSTVQALRRSFSHP